MPQPPRHLRDVAVIAHVDHGKTTLVDALLAHCGAMERARIEAGDALVMDSDPIERERGITIFSKQCAIDHVPASGPLAGTSVRVNLIDTPGHADFGGEVERVLGMADGVLLLVDAFEGPMPQTRFVLEKALRLGHRLLVVVNKCDRPNARPDEVINEVFDLLVALDAPDEALEFPVLYASGRDGWAGPEPTDPGTGMTPLLDAIVEQVPPPPGDPAAPLQMLVTNVEWSDYVGRIAVGRVTAGTLRAGAPVALCLDGGRVRQVRPLKVHRFRGLGREEVPEVSAGDLCAVEGLGEPSIGDTIASLETPVPLPRVEVDEPTLHMVFRVNDAPTAGREGTFVTARQLADRLQREARSNVALRVESGEGPEEYRVSGRGLLHLGVTIENMRREGYEFAVGRPEVVMREIDGQLHEPLERLTVLAPPEDVGSVIELVGGRGGEIQHMEPRGDRTRLEFEIPARGLIGLRTRVLTATAGEAILVHAFERWVPLRSGERKRQQGVLVSLESGVARAYALQGLHDRGTMFVEPQEPVYAGQVVGEHNREKDLEVNVVRNKQLTNFRESNKEATVTLKAPRRLTLEDALEYIEDDELVEVTPASIRLRKRMLSATDRKRALRHQRNAAAGAVP